MSEVWSCGGGTQSAAIAALIVRGELPKPDVSVIADTGREASETWRYFNDILQPELKKVGVDLVRLPHSFDGDGWNTVDLWGGKDKTTALIPAFTTLGDSIGQTSKFCSNEWKTRPTERYYKSKGLKGGNIWIGFSIDELHRMRSHDHDAKWNHWYPLVERRMSRGDCIALVEKMGWPKPPRSSCWMCPYRTKAEWKHLIATDPEDFQSAIGFDEELRTVDAALFVHKSALPLSQVNFDDSGQLDLVDQCASGMCFT